MIFFDERWEDSQEPAFLPPLFRSLYCDIRTISRRIQHEKPLFRYPGFPCSLNTLITRRAYWQHCRSFLHPQVSRSAFCPSDTDALVSLSRLRAHGTASGTIKIADRIKRLFHFSSFSHRIGSSSDFQEGVLPKSIPYPKYGASTGFSAMASASGTSTIQKETRSSCTKPPSCSFCPQTSTKSKGLGCGEMPIGS